MTDETHNNAGAANHPGRWTLIRDAFAFQLKLLADGLRDLIFAPVSIVLALIDLVTGGNRFYNLLQLGQRTDHWINLFGNYGGESQGIDDVVKKVETMIATQYEKGGMTASAKRSVDKALDKLNHTNPDKDTDIQP